MDVKVYRKEEVLQPTGDGYESVYVPDVIDIIPEFIETETTKDVKDNIWTLDKLRRIAEVKIVDGKLILNSDKIRYENGNLIITLTEEQLYNCEIVENEEMLEQQCALATIFQRGLDPLDLEDGIRWSEAILEELSSLQLIQDIIEAVGKVSSAVTVTFDTVEDDNGNSYLSYKITEVT